MIEDIKAENNQVLSIIDTSNGKIAIAILMKSFMFEKSLMEEHFNENYVESNIYPKATFKGEILDFKLLKTGKNDVSIKGNITIHGITKSIETKAQLTKTEENILLNGTFPLTVTDFDIKIPSVVTKNISDTMAITFDLNHEPYTK
tara:strand:+ start:280 stop:717 length:438 start_codon:yes stop_codon:yes gene_type:complete